MAGLFADGRIVDGILLFVAVEALGLTLWWRHARGGRWPLALLCNLTSGAALMLALRASLTGAGWPAIAGCLAVSGLAHATEIALRVGAFAAPGGVVRTIVRPEASTPAGLDPRA